MEIPFMHQGHGGRVMVAVAKTTGMEFSSANNGAFGLANCTATIEYDGQGYVRLFGWIQLVRSSDNAFQGRQFEIDPFDPFNLYENAPLPYCWYGIAPTLFDAPSRDERAPLDWVAHSFLAVSPLDGNCRIVTPLLGFSWGFQIVDKKNTSLKPVTLLAAADWETHLPYLRDIYKDWQFMEMQTPAI